jgi:hypothetical protein
MLKCMFILGVRLWKPEPYLENLLKDNSEAGVKLLALYLLSKEKIDIGVDHPAVC